MIKKYKISSIQWNRRNSMLCNSKRKVVIIELLSVLSKLYSSFYFIQYKSFFTKFISPNSGSFFDLKIFNKFTVWSDQIILSPFIFIYFIYKLYKFWISFFINFWTFAIILYFFVCWCLSKQKKIIPSFILF